MMSPGTGACATEKHTLDFKLRPGLSLSLLLVAAVLVCYHPVIYNGFLNYDDDAYITSNAHVRAGLNWKTVKWAFTSYDAANYHPLTWLSHAFDCQLFGLKSGAHHEVSVILHAACAVLLFLLLLLATGFPGRSFFAAALFALHPVNVESVAWAAERKNVLSMLFFLLAMHAYVWYARRPRAGRYVFVVLLFVLALLSKPQVITFPFLLLLFDYWPLCRIGSAQSESRSDETAVADEECTAHSPRKSVSWLLLEKIPFLVLSVASAVITMRAQRAGGAVQTLAQYSPLLRFETAVIAYVRYLGKAFWPVNLVALYPHPTSLYPAWQVGAALLLLTVISVVVGVVVFRAAKLRGVNSLCHSRGYLVFGWLWFLGALVPMLGLVQVGSQAMADRYAYIPYLGLFIMATWLAADFARARHLSALAPATLGVICLVVLGTLTYRQVTYWHDTQSFWQRTIALTKNNYVAHDSLGEYLLEEGGRNEQEAAAQFRAALAIRPDDLPANLNLGTYEHSRGNLREAIARYQVVALHAADLALRAKAYGNLGSVYRQFGDLAAAKQCFEESLELEPEHPLPMAFIGLGLVAQKSGDFAEAVRDYSRAMAIEPTDVGYLLMARALEQEGRSDEARAIEERVARLSPNLAEAQATARALTGR
ncbi:MAG: tetratricopeptide repeat protein [Terriglobales bacterium]